MDPACRIFGAPFRLGLGALLLLILAFVLFFAGSSWADLAPPIALGMAITGLFQLVRAKRLHRPIWLGRWSLVMNGLALVVSGSLLLVEIWFFVMVWGIDWTNFRE